MHGWTGIDEFAAVASLGSFSAGAKQFGASTTHMSRSIARLEKRIQVQLFNRTTRSVKLTEAGRVFFEHCERFIREREEAIALFSKDGQPEGELRITCSTALGESFVVPIVQRYAQGHERLSITIDLTNRIVDLVGEGYDLAIRTGHLPDSRLITTKIATRSLVTCATPAYLAQHGQPERNADLAGHNCLIGSSATWHFRSDGGEVNFRPKGRWRCNNGVAILNAALAGMGICQLPAFYVHRHIAEGSLVPLLENEMPAEEPVWAVYTQRRHLLPKVSHLVDLLKRELPGALHNISG
jgi:DNA-binding transcriptional LysR family regulator